MKHPASGRRRTGGSTRKAKSSVRKRASARARKISITVDDHVLRNVEKDARAAGNSLSAHVTEALARDVRRRRLQALIEDFEDQHGTITEQELASIRLQWQD